MCAGCVKCKCASLFFLVFIYLSYSELYTYFYIITLRNESQRGKISTACELQGWFIFFFSPHSRIDVLHIHAPHPTSHSPLSTTAPLYLIHIHEIVRKRDAERQSGSGLGGEHPNQSCHATCTPVTSPLHPGVPPRLRSSISFTFTGSIGLLSHL